jgi:tetrahydromethanopterin S-methyltransferase subunit G
MKLECNSVVLRGVRTVDILAGLVVGIVLLANVVSLIDAVQSRTQAGG